MSNFPRLIDKRLFYMTAVQKTALRSEEKGVQPTPFQNFAYEDPMDMFCPAYAAIVRSIDYAAIIWAKHIVVHGVRVPTGFGSELNLEYNTRFYVRP